VIADCRFTALIRARIVNRTGMSSSSKHQQIEGRMTPRSSPERNPYRRALNEVLEGTELFNVAHRAALGQAADAWDAQNWLAQEKLDATRQEAARIEPEDETPGWQSQRGHKRAITERRASDGTTREVLRPGRDDRERTPHNAPSRT
jgi:hypothetical protein